MRYKKENNLELGIFIFLLLFPLLPIYVTFFTISGVRFNGINILSIIFLLPFIISKLANKKMALPSYKNIDLLIILIIEISIIIDAINSPEASTGYFIKNGIFQSIFWLTPYLAFSRYCTTPEKIRKILKISFIGSIPILIFGFYEFVTANNVFLNLPMMDKELAKIWGNDLYRGEFIRIKTSFAQPISFATYLEAIFLYAFVYLNSYRMKIFNRMVFSAYLILVFVALIMTQSRAPIIVCISLVIVYLIFKSPRRLFIYGIIFIIAFVLLQNYAFDNLLFYNNTSTQMQNLTVRSNLWDTALNSLDMISLWGGGTVDKASWLPVSLRSDIISWYVENLVFRGLIFFLFHIIVISSITVLMIKKIIGNKYYLITVLPVLSFIINYISVSFIGTGPYFFWITLAIFMGSLQISKYPAQTIISKYSGKAIMPKFPQRTIVSN